MKFVKKIYRFFSNFYHKIINKLTKKSDKVLTKNLFLKKLLKYDIISFDIFDTLITRTIYDPDNIFQLMQEKIKDIKLKDTIFNMRKNAEKSAMEKLHKDVNIDEIYFELGNLYGYDEKTINAIKGLEVELEYKLITPRKDMVEVLEKLVKENKKVILISDMYLNKNIIEKLLSKCGYNREKHYHKIYVSNEKNKRKDTGTMWEYIKKIYNGMKFIHVGDNIESDYNVPVSYGLKAMKINNPRVQFKNTDYFLNFKQFIDKKTVGDSIFLGYIINEQIFNSPFCNKINDLSVFSKTFTAPVIYSFIEFIDAQTSKNDKLLFLAREGYNLIRLYDNYVSLFGKDDREKIYFLASRRATYSATIFDINDIKKIMNKEYHGKIKTYLNSIFGVDYKGLDFDINLPDDYNKIEKIVLDYSSEILDISNINRKNYIKYIESLFDYNNESVFLIDLGYSGTIQYNLSKFLNYDFKGLYLTNSDSVKKYSSKSKLNFNFDIADNEMYKKIYHYSLILEFFLSAPFGQLQYFKTENEKIIPVYNDEKMSEKKEKIIESIYESVVEYMMRMREITELCDFEVSKELLCLNYISLIESGIIDRSVKDNYDFIDSFNYSE